jgi:CBS domain-containing protein
VSPKSSIGSALVRAYEHDYTHLTVVSDETRALLGYIAMPKLRQLLQEKTVSEEDSVEQAMMRFRRRGRTYWVITMDTPLEELEGFFEGEAPRGEDTDGKGGKEVDGQLGAEGKRDFAIVTDQGRRFVLGVATRWDLDEFVRRRPGY